MSQQKATDEMAEMLHSMVAANRAIAQLSAARRTIEAIERLLLGWPDIAERDDGIIATRMRWINNELAELAHLVSIASESVSVNDCPKPIRG